MQTNELKNQVEYLSQRVEQQQVAKSRISSCLNTIQPKGTKENKQYATFSPQLIKNDVVSSHIIPFGSPFESKHTSKSKEFVPNDIVFQQKKPRPSLPGQLGSA
jgi:hypothetical protein